MRSRPSASNSLRGLRQMRPTLIALEGRALLSTIVVTNTAGSGTGSLPWAVGQANANDGDETIVFDKTAFRTPQTITLSGTPLDSS
jgi:hypothetical protein